MAVWAEPTGQFEFFSNRPDCEAQPLKYLTHIFEYRSNPPTATLILTGVTGSGIVRIYYTEAQLAPNRGMLYPTDHELGLALNFVRDWGRDACQVEAARYMLEVGPKKIGLYTETDWAWSLINDFKINLVDNVEEANNIANRV